MTTGTESDQVRTYLAEVSQALADLAQDVRDDLLEDLDSHLREVLAEGDGSLEQRLGPPARYAAELRSSAGLDPAERPAGNVAHRLADAIYANDMWRRVSQQRIARAVVEFVPQLRPAWWVVRAWLAVEFIVEFGRWSRGYGGELVITLVPTISGSQLLGAILVILAVPISIQLGRRSLRGAGRFLVVAGNVLAVAILVPTVSALSGATYYASVAQAVPAQGVYNDGHPVSNIYPYDDQGHPLDHVRLYDDSGEPLNNLTGLANEDGGGCYKSCNYPAPSVAASVVPTAAPTAFLGRPLNDYPQPATVTIYGPDGNPSLAAVPRPTIVVPPLPTPTSPTATPSPSVSPVPSVSPSPSASLTPSPSAAASSKPGAAPRPTPSAARSAGN